MKYTSSSCLSNPTYLACSLSATLMVLSFANINAVALRLALKDHKVTAFNRDRSKIEKLLTNGTANLKIAHQPKEIGDTCDITLICVKDYQAVENVTFMTGGFLNSG